MVLRGANLSVARISTHAIEAEFAAYGVISDAIGWTYQQDGHVFYVLTFPSADKTWVYDEASRLWHERVWTDSDGAEHRIRPQAYSFAYGKHMVGDWENGNLYEWDLDTYTDNGDPIVRRRGFPHLIENADRIFYNSFTADIQVGTASGTGEGDVMDISLRWSDTRGQTWSNALEQSMGLAGQYLTSPQWNSLGMARDRVFELFWSTNMKTALNGGFADFKVGKS